MDRFAGAVGETMMGLLAIGHNDELEKDGRYLAAVVDVLIAGY